MTVTIVCLHGVVTPTEASTESVDAVDMTAARINPAGATIEVTEDLARRLVAIGAARYADAAQAGTV